MFTTRKLYSVTFISSYRAGPVNGSNTYYSKIMKMNLTYLFEGDRRKDSASVHACQCIEVHYVGYADLSSD